MTSTSDRVAVLVSGGLDSAVLVADLARQGRKVSPIYVRCGLNWELAELEMLWRFLAAISGPGVQPLVVLDMPVHDIYGPHWSLTGAGVPDEHSPDEAVYLPGRNLLLVLKAMLWCHLNEVPALALGVLKGNPFPDATAEFFQQFATAVNQGVAGNVTIERPYARLHKEDVIRRGAGLPLQWTLSCMRPSAGWHCGRCNKCAERQKAFAAAGVADPTEYNTRG